MTIEQAKEVLKNHTQYFIPTEDIHALNIAIKSLEAWDKIRTEIEALEYLNIEDGSNGYDKYIEQYEVLKIIDKYKEESEE